MKSKMLRHRPSISRSNVGNFFFPFYYTYTVAESERLADVSLLNAMLPG